MVFLKQIAKMFPLKKTYIHIWFVVDRFIILSYKSLKQKKVFLMLLCNVDNYFSAFNAFLCVSYLYYCLASVCMPVSLLHFNYPLRYERDLSNLCWRVFLLEKTRNSVNQTLCQKHVFLSEDKNNLNMEERFYMAEYFSIRGHEV